MLGPFRIPTLFVTLTFFEKWPFYQKHLARARNCYILPSNRPWDAVQYYFERLHLLRKEFLQKPAYLQFGRLLEMVAQHEFQQ